LKRQGYRTPRPEELDKVSMSGADLDYLREMDSLGYRVQDVRSLMYLYNMGLDPEYIAEANAQSGRKLSISELHAFKKRAERDLTTAERDAPSPSVVENSSTARDDTRIDDTIVDGKWALRLRADGQLQLNIEWANVNQWQRTIRPSDLAGLTLREIATSGSRSSFEIRQDAGVFEMNGDFHDGKGTGRFVFKPNTAFGDTLRALGVQEIGTVRIHDLKNLAFGFVSATTVRNAIAANGSDLTYREVMDMAVHRMSAQGFPR
jgi:hypothetical protein